MKIVFVVALLASVVAALKDETGFVDFDGDDQPVYETGFPSGDKLQKKMMDLAKYGMPLKQAALQNDVRESLDDRILRGMLLRQNAQEFKTKSRQGKVMQKLFGIGRRFPGGCIRENC
ncbi:hypothetical protein CAPTEDRAFT_190906 [Capitella teleta]|uniref:Uncharacterized protein n=1 Tax=Capitella teleta TaxID=283909 RepID=R7UB14_CAPTE|nr:hypothetical protein CAPTEDRAFT_190906 [Capitella teleta]|eukprot:ELU00432.1 hypothetical protein CAPTEDRAFT_190906 [Capitella teleta]